MKDVLVRAGSSVLAAAVGFIVLTVFASSLRTSLKLMVAAALGLCAFGIAAWAAGGPKDASGAVKFISNIKGERAEMEDVHAEVDPSQTAEILSNIETE